jgi:hypothetical protein
MSNNGLAALASKAERVNMMRIGEPPNRAARDTCGAAISCGGNVTAVTQTAQ